MQFELFNIRKRGLPSFGAIVTTVCLFFFVIGRVLTRLDQLC